MTAKTQAQYIRWIRHSWMNGTWHILKHSDGKLLTTYCQLVLSEDGSGAPGNPQLLSIDEPPLQQTCPNCLVNAAYNRPK